MALTEMRVCDVCKRTKEVRAYVLTLGEEQTDNKPCSWHRDLCPSDVKRLQRFIQRGMTPPSAKVKTP